MANELVMVVALLFASVPLLGLCVCCFLQRVHVWWYRLCIFGVANELVMVVVLRSRCRRACVRLWPTSCL